MSPTSALRGLLSNNKPRALHRSCRQLPLEAQPPQKQWSTLRCTSTLNLRISKLDAASILKPAHLFQARDTLRSLQAKIWGKLLASQGRRPDWSPGPGALIQGALFLGVVREPAVQTCGSHCIGMGHVHTARSQKSPHLPHGILTAMWLPHPTSYAQPKIYVPRQDEHLGQCAALRQAADTPVLYMLLSGRLSVPSLAPLDHRALTLTAHSLSGPQTRPGSPKAMRSRGGPLPLETGLPIPQAWLLVQRSLRSRFMVSLGKMSENRNVMLNQAPAELLLFSDRPALEASLGLCGSGEPSPSALPSHTARPDPSPAHHCSRILPECPGAQTGVSSADGSWPPLLCSALWRHSGQRVGGLVSGCLGVKCASTTVS